MMRIYYVCAGYAGISSKHKLYGALSKLNGKLGDKAVHWFMEGWPGSEIVSDLSPQDEDKDEDHVHINDHDHDHDHVVMRSQHVPHELVSLLKKEGVQSVYLTGAKASGSVQVACQLLMDHSIDVTIPRECVQDDNVERLNATLDHLLPIYGNIITLKEAVEDVGGFETLSPESKDSLIDIMAGGTGGTALYAADCGRRGHGKRFIEILLERGGSGWKSYPTQIWYEHFVEGEYHCPLGKKVVDFCDEPNFSKVAMYLSGREHLDEKDKVIEIAGRFMPKTYCIEEGKWVGDEPPPDLIEGATSAPWFIKESDKNLGGNGIVIVSKPSDIMGSIQENKRYVVQQHIQKPLLTDDGRKTHVKFYVLLISTPSSIGTSWTLYTYKGSLLSISPQRWSPTDLSQDTQVTIHRHPEPPGDTDGWKQHWESVYEKCKQGTSEIIEKAITTGKLKGRAKKQFEVFSTDWMPDTDGNNWMFEFNMSPAVAQREFDDPTSRDVRRDYLMHHDHVMLKEALSIVMPFEKGRGPGQWDLAGKFEGK